MASYGSCGVGRGCDLLARSGHWQRVHKRFTRWTWAGVGERVFAHLTADRHNNYLLLDSTIVWAHQQAVTGKGRTGTRLGGNPEADGPPRVIWPWIVRGNPSA